MANPRVLQIGIDPEVVDFSPWPGQDAAALNRRIDDATTALGDAGFDVTICLLDGDPRTAESALREKFAGRVFDVVEIGAGIRTSEAHTVLFETVVNAVNALQPGVPFCFNDSPETTLHAVRRILANPRGGSPAVGSERLG